MNVLVAMLFLAMFLGVFFTTTLAFALSMFDRPAEARQSALARLRAELAEPPPVDSQDPRLPL